MKVAGTRPQRAILLCVAFATCGPLGVARAPAFEIDFNYLFDTQGFFDDPVRKATLEAAGDFISSFLAETLSPITPGGVNSWTANFSHPGTGRTQSLIATKIPANTIVVYAGGRALDGAAIGIGGPGGFSAQGTQAWLNTVSRRGGGNTQSPGAVDFAPWGGSITFDTGVVWHDDYQTLPTFGQNDLYSVALHELLHVLGFGASDSFQEKVNQALGTFVGTSASLEAGGPVSMDPGRSHWASGTQSESMATGLSAEASMTPAIPVGSRKYTTSLDLQGLRDIGWTLSGVPPPLPGDVNGDRKVDLSDFNALKANFLFGAQRSQGDLNADFQVNLLDFNILKENFGVAGVVPEPASWTLLAAASAAGAFILARRRTR